jgi:hypothetical protein
MNFLKLTQPSLSNGIIQEKTIYLNPQHIKEFHRSYSDNLRIDVTLIYWAVGGFNPTSVIETPEDINWQLVAC